MSPKVISHLRSQPNKMAAPRNDTAEWQVLSVNTPITEGVLHFTVGAKGN